MIDMKDLRQRPDLYRDAARHKRINVDVDHLLHLDAEHRRLLTESQSLAARKNQIGKQIGQLAGRLKKAPPQEQPALEQQMRQLQQEPAQLKEQEAALASRLAELEPKLHDLLLLVPQPPDEEVPIGPDESGNVELRRWGQVRHFDFDTKDHLTLGTSLGIIDVERGVKLAGTRNYFLLGAGAMLHHAVLRLAMDLMLQRGFTPMAVPVLMREAAMRGTGYLPLGRDQTYTLTSEDPPLYLTGTAEVPLTAFHMDELLEESSLPRQYVAMSPCFRREAGTYGRDTAGLYRIHQFDKVEQVVICRNDVEESKRWHTQILQNAEAVLQALELPYRVVQVCTGDLGQGQAAKYDIETWMPSRRGWGETHSASRFYDFQARRLNLRYRDASGTVRFCHTLNNTVIASPRILIPILELYQNPDGSVTIPAALRPYMRGVDRISRD
jgi:seryl-tRNA synthetase